MEGPSPSELSAITETILVLLMHHLDNVSKAVQQPVPTARFGILRRGMKWMIGVEKDAGLKNYLKYASRFLY